MDPFTMMAAAGAGSSILQGVFGSQGASDAAAAQAAAIQQGKAAYDGQADNARGSVNTSTDKALGYYQPYSSAGTDALAQYKNAIGVNGAPAEKQYFDTFQNDPGFNAALKLGGQQVQQAAIFNGSGNSGAAQKALFSYGQGQQYSAFQDRLNRLSSLSQVGLQAGGASAGLESSRGNTLAGIDMQQGAADLNALTGIGTAEAGGIAGSTNAINGMIGGLGSAASVYGIGQGVSNGNYSSADALKALGSGTKVSIGGNGNATSATPGANIIFH